MTLSNDINTPKAESSTDLTAVSIRPEITISASGAIDISIETHRLQIRSVTMGDLSDYSTKLYGDAVVMEKYGAGIPRDAEYVRERLHAWTKRHESGDPFSAFAVLKKDSGELIGHLVMGYGKSPGSSELAYIFAKEHWNQGYGSEAAHAVVNHLAPLLRAYGFQARGGDTNEPAEFRQIEATARHDNPASLGILKSVGMELTGKGVYFNQNIERHEMAKEVPLPDAGGSWTILTGPSGMKITES